MKQRKKMKRSHSKKVYRKGAVINRKNLLTHVQRGGIRL